MSDKAINLQNLVDIKDYITENYYNKNETDAMIKVKVVSEASSKVNEMCHSKEQMDGMFYKKTDTVTNVVNAENANYAENVVTATNATYTGYASSDTTKGTIEDRLSNLGF